MADQNINLLNESIIQYKIQLSQVQLAVASSSPGPDRENLISLQRDIQELINLTEENLSSLHKQQNGECSSAQQSSTVEEDPFEKEYALFKAELKETEESPESEDDLPNESINLADIQDELEALQGMKCQAPHSHQWGDTSYHNALVYCTEPCKQVSDMSHIQVRVMFTNPTHREMLPCPYYLEGECKFSNDQCHFSHGELVLLSSLKEYREPDFSLVRPGLRVLVKHSDKLWHRAIVSAVHDKSRCDVKFESNGTRLEVDLHNILPLGDGGAEPAESSSSSEDDSEDEPILDPTLVEQSIANPLSSALGSWEVHTKGIGSRLMARMGYITGTGLGKLGEGRIEPVEAIVLPPGKSLDHCMLLREQAGGDENLFKVERRLKKLHRKQAQQQRKQQDGRKQTANVFDFINSKLGSKKGSVSQLADKPQESRSSLKGETCRGLNVVGFQVGEEIRRTERDLAKLEESLSRHSTGSTTHGRIAEKLQDKRGELNQLQASQRSIDQERSIRKDQKKLSIF